MGGLRPRGTGEDDGPESPEALFISALLDSGTFDPARYRINEDDLACWRKLFTFGNEYQLKEGVAPPIDLVKRHFPTFEFVPSVGPSWAAHELHRVSSSRRLRTKLREAISHLDNEDVTAAFDTLEGLSRPRSASKAAVSAFDHGHVEQGFDVSKIPVPFQALGRATGGIAPAEFWLLGARQGVGKTQIGAAFVGTAVKAGYHVRYISCEMPAWEIAQLARRNMARNDPKILALLDSKDLLEVKKGIDMLKERIDGSLHVVDPSHARITSSTIQEHQLEGADLVVVDHIGLVSTNDGRRAIDDWRAMATISNVTKEGCLATSVPVLAMVQLNREADSGGFTPPKLSNIGQSDALGQDCDKAVLMKRPIEQASVMVYGAEKVRGGRSVRWYSRYRPDVLDYSEVSKDQAREIAAQDEDRLMDS